MVGEWHRLDPGPVLYAVHSCLDSIQTVLHPRNTEPGRFHRKRRDVLKLLVLALDGYGCERGRSK